MELVQGEGHAYHRQNWRGRAAQDCNSSRTLDARGGTLGFGIGIWSSPSCCGCDIGFPSVQTCKPNKPLLIKNYPVCAVLLFQQKVSEDSGIWLLGYYREHTGQLACFEEDFNTV